LPKILQLDSHVADLIAAGEVVERPASVVKELMENSIDADAGVVTVEISAGGMTHIRITDNGCGIEPEDVRTAFLRHATSKLRNAEGLESINTLGFRGEALAAISAVSRIELLTRVPGADEGVRLLLEAGEVVDFAPVGCPEGTTIIVRDLFYNTPARLKFMKSDRAESSAVSATVLRCALARPDVSVRFIKDGQTEYHTPGDSRVDSCVYSLFGREFSAGLLEADASDEAVSVSGFVSSPDAARGNRSYQFFFVNGRPIKSITLQVALEKAYENLLHSGKFPSCVLYVSTKPSHVDVNVHPAKTEVKFVSDKQVFDGVYYAVLGALEQGGVSLRPGARTHAKTPGAGFRRNADTTHTHLRDSLFVKDGGAFDAKKIGHKTGGGGGFKSMNADEFRKAFAVDQTQSASYKTGGFANVHTGGTRQTKDNASYVSDLSDNKMHTPVAVNDDFDPQLLKTSHSMQEVARHTHSDISNNDIALENSLSENPPRVIGEAFQSYIIAQHDDRVWFIDKHAAHERLHFNALKSEGFEPMSQALITPVICRFGVEDAALLLEHTALLDGLGFEVESFGDDSIAVRRISAEIDVGDTESVLSDICSVLSLGGTVNAARLDDIYKTIACKASIKAGRASMPRELELLAAKVFSGEASHCPHGRPVFFEVSKAELDKRFKRS